MKDLEKIWLSNLQCLWNAQNRKMWHSGLLQLKIPISEHPSKRAVTQIIFQKWFYRFRKKICVTTLLDGCSEMGISWSSTQKCETFEFKLFENFYVENSFLKLFWKETACRVLYQWQQEWQWILVKLRLNTYNCTYSTLPMLFYWIFPARFLLLDQAFVNINPEERRFY